MLIDGLIIFFHGIPLTDSKVADMLRRSKKPVVLVVNKVDSFKKFMPDVYEFYNLGIGGPCLTSVIKIITSAVSMAICACSLI